MNILYTNGTDRWLTPPDLITALGPFDLDPCAEPWMPWRTAKTMISLPPHGNKLAKDGRFEEASIVPGHPKFMNFQASIIDDGLKYSWQGRVFMNHPYSHGLPWALKMMEHNHGIALTTSKSLDTVWGQVFLRRCSMAYFMAGRLLFHYPNGLPSTGKWLPNVLWAFGEEDARELVNFADANQAKWPGTLMVRR